MLTVLLGQIGDLFTPYVVSRGIYVTCGYTGGVLMYAIPAYRLRKRVAALAASGHLTQAEVDAVLEGKHLPITHEPRTHG